MGLNHSITKMYLIGAATVGVSRTKRTRRSFAFLVRPDSYVGFAGGERAAGRHLDAYCRRWLTAATSRPTPSVDPVTSTVLFSMFIRYQEPAKIRIHIQRAVWLRLADLTT
jgi:hypothetical protein